jgi:hypothetical protein
VMLADDGTKQDSQWKNVVYDRRTVLIVI